MPAGRELAEIAGTQIAWWQLGFRQRRAVVRQARQGEKHSDPQAWADARQWARRMLDAPWWWRLVRAILITGFAVLGVAATAGVAIEFQAEYAISAGVLTVVPLAIAWAWRQTRIARLIDRVDPAERSRKANPRWVPVVIILAAVAAVATSVIVIIHTVQANHDRVYGCPLRPADPQILAWWVRHDGKSGIGGCPTGESGITAGGEPWIRTTTGTVAMTPTVGAFLVTDDFFEVWQANWPALGNPLGPPFGNGHVTYIDFERGHIMQEPGRPPVSAAGPYEPKQVAGGPCVKHDRPCLIRADRDGTKIHLAWHWGITDAFNVAWQALDHDRATSVEVAGNSYTITGLDPRATYLIQLQACEKQFLSSSKCTPQATYVAGP